MLAAAVAWLLGIEQRVRHQLGVRRASGQQQWLLLGCSRRLLLLCCGTPHRLGSCLCQLASQVQLALVQLLQQQRPKAACTGAAASAPAA